MRNFFHKYKLFIQIVLAIILGILIGQFTPYIVVEIFIALNILIGKFLAFSVPLIIIGFVVKGISSLGKSSGKMLALTTILSYVFMISASIISYIVAVKFFPMILNNDQSLLSDSVSLTTGNFISQISSIQINPIMDVVPALILSFIIGIGISATNSVTIKNVCSEYHDIINLLVQKVIVPILPLYVLGIFSKMSYTGEVFKILFVFSKVFLIIISLHTLILIIQYTIAGIVSGKSPLKLIKNILPAYFSALATQSSVAVIPITLKQTKNINVSHDVADFVIPLCSTIHLSGSTISITCCSIAVMMLNNVHFDFLYMFPFIILLCIMMVAAPGVPCGAIIAASGILQSILGFDSAMLSLIIALHVAQDGFGTACNISGDCAIAIIIDKLNKKLNSKNKTENCLEYNANT